ncbi:1,6-anhydro-N-acetylmuramyl-L-alanine amidase AmpD [uncultured Thiothrix sp.]|uniref:1,6-anhydro-N-acetylmuramyl-L-alanine amidase AmpD n=1 Tax=uncultured Thiothrix sp. TaxID=223185 RepID=UPI00262F7BC2|nr:1,6-anhydro-N-acetylmuramyl-L-alanine amidase AmpD [uncultured Thiothrix sp.]
MVIDHITSLLVEAQQCPSPNHDERPDGCLPELIVVHNITLPPGEFGGDYINQLFTNTLNKDAHPFFAEICHLKVASHLLIRRDGQIIQYVPFHLRAFHAGLSIYRGRSRCNDFSIGIELEGTDFTPFTEEQYQQLTKVIQALCLSYPSLSLEQITGHQHIAPERKTDPGPFFDWLRLGQDLGVHLPADAEAR